MKGELTFRFDELTIDRKRLIKLLGYEKDGLPEPFPTYLEQVIQDCFSLDDIRGTFRMIEDVEVGKRTILADGVEFRVGRTILEELSGSEKLAFFICTAGRTISERSSALLHGEDPVLGYVYDVMGSEIVEAVADRIQQMIQAEAGKEEMKITNRYSPGYCHWNVVDQHKLFSLFNGNPCDISLTDSALMNPVKSISGVIGIGKKVEFHDYQCALCNMKNCAYRKEHLYS